MLVHGEELRHLDAFSAEVRSTASEHLIYIIFGLGTYFSPVNTMPKQNRAMRHVMRKSRSLKLRHYDAHMVDLNDHLAVFPG